MTGQGKVKSIWEKPMLIILERGRPEELVLAGCKMSGVIAPGSTRNTCAARAGGQCTANCVNIETS